LYARGAVIRVVMLTDRSPAEVLPAAPTMLLDLKTEHLSVAAVGEALALGTDAVLRGRRREPGSGARGLRALREREPRIPLLAVIERRDVERFHWEEVADEVLFPGAPEGEIRLRFALSLRRTGAGEETTIRLGPIALDASTYRVSVEGAPLDLTFKEFELLRFLAERRAASSPGRPCCGRSGATTSTAVRGRSTSTSVGCARSSGPPTRG
jgi:Response regulators consisting of a CheY-like receiver domain and a winged-helix DNA-binding domain